MASTKQKWFVGCGVGCLVIIAAVAVVVYFTVMKAKQVVKEFEKIETSQEQVRERFGDGKDFCPALDGKIPAERIEAFLKARDTAAEQRAKLAVTLDGFSDAMQKAADGREDEVSGWEMFKSGMGFVPQLVKFMQARNEGFLAANISPGEYTYYHVITYYAWLQKPLEDGPGIQITGQGAHGGTGQQDPEVVKANRRRELAQMANRTLLPMMRCQLAAIGDPGGPGEVATWQAALNAEIIALENDPRRIPWQEGVPPAVFLSLEPFRERLETSYSPQCNPLEMGLSGKHSRH